MRTQSSELFILDPFPGELLYSTVARTHHLLGWSNKLATLKKVFSFNSTSVTTVYNLKIFKDLAQACSHIVHPYYLSAFSLQRQKGVLEKIYNPRLHANASRPLIFNRYKQFKKTHLYYCPLCLKEDLEKIGMSYFRTVDQYGGVTACSKHKTRLLPYPYDREVQINLPVLLPQDYTDPEPATSFEVELSQWAGEFKGFSREYLLALYHTKILHSQDLLKATPNSLYESIYDFFGSQIMNRVDRFSKSSDHPWVRALLEKDGNSTHPVYHFLFQKFLGLSCEDLKRPIVVIEGESKFLPYSKPLEDLDFLKCAPGIEIYFDHAIERIVLKLFPIKSIAEFLDV